MAVVREYLHAEQLAVLTPWSVDAIEQMVRRGTFKLGLHYFQPLGHGTKKLFKWSAIVAFIEAGKAANLGEGTEVVVRPPHGSARGLDVDALTTRLQGLVD